MNLTDTVFEGDDKSYFTCGREKHLLTPCNLDIQLRAFNTY